MTKQKTEQELGETKFCRHLVPQDAKHFCNICQRECKSKALSYEEVIEQFDNEIEGWDYQLNDAIWRKEKFEREYLKLSQEKHD